MDKFAVFEFARVLLLFGFLTEIECRKSVEGDPVPMYAPRMRYPPQSTSPMCPIRKVSGLMVRAPNGEGCINKEEVEFSCDITCDCNPEVFWFKSVGSNVGLSNGVLNVVGRDDIPINRNGTDISFYNVTGKSVLVFHRPQLEHSGRYICAAQAPSHSESAQSWPRYTFVDCGEQKLVVNVRVGENDFKKEFTSKHPTTDPEPLVVTFALGDEVELYCRDPAPRESSSGKKKNPTWSPDGEWTAGLDIEEHVHSRFIIVKSFDEPIRRFTCSGGTDRVPSKAVVELRKTAIEPVRPSNTSNF